MTLSVGVCGYCGGRVAYEGVRGAAVCGCGRSSIPAAFMRVASLPREMSTAAAMDRHRFKYAGFSGPHPSLVVPCPTCESPAGCYCNDDDGNPTDRPHEPRRVAAGTTDRG